MTEIIIAQRMWQRRGTIAQWTAANPILEAGEIGVELGATTADTKFKIGNGVALWSALPYAGGGTGTGVTDGDKGDITVSGTGTVWTLDPNTVTNAKLADVPTATLKGRTTASAGDPEDLTAAQARALLNIADGATANATDAALRDRGTHTGAQAQSTITGLDTSLAAKADLVSGKVPTSQLPAVSIGETFPAASEAAMLALTAEVGDVAIRSDLSSRKYLLLGTSTVLADWVEMDGGGAVSSVNSQTGVVLLAASDVGADVAGAAAAAQAAAQTYSDGKVIDSIADADVDHAPSRNAVFDALGLKANDSAVVKTTDAQTIDGVKTFLQNPVIKSGGVAIWATAAGANSNFALYNSVGQLTTLFYKNGTDETVRLRRYVAGVFGGEFYFDANYAYMNGVNLVPQSRFLSADVASTSTTAATIPELTFAAVAGKKYLVKFKGMYTTEATTTGCRLGFNFTGTGTMVGSLQGGISRANATPLASVIKITTAYQITTSGNATVGDFCHIEGEFVLNCIASGDILVQWGSEVSGSTATLAAGSALVVQEMA